MKVQLAALALALAAAGGCAKKGSGKGTRDRRPNFKDSGTIGDNGPLPPSPPDGQPDNDPTLDPEAARILAACFKVDVSEVSYVPGWDDPAKARAGAAALCAKLQQVGYDAGVSPTAAQVAVD